MHSISSHYQLLILPKQFHSSTLIESHRNNVEIYHGESLCKQKLPELLEELALPKDLFRADINEMGYHWPSGFVWLKQRKKSEQELKATGKTIFYNAELTMLVEKGGIKQLKGWTAKETNGLSGTCPALAFEDKDDKDN